MADGQRYLSFNISETKYGTIHLATDIAITSKGLVDRPKKNHYKKNHPLTIISFTNQENYRNHTSKVFWIIFWPKLRFPNFQRELSLYVLLLIVNFYEQFLKLNFQGNNLNLSLKITYKDKITDIKKIPCKIATAVNSH